MSILDNIQQRFFQANFEKKHRQRNTDKAFVPLNKGGKIGIVCDFRTTTSQPVAIAFYKKIKKENTEVKVLLIISEKRADINQYDYDKLFPGAEVLVLCPEDLNFFKVPKKNAVAGFTATKFDIVFRLHLEPEIIIDSVILLTNSRMYAGVDHPGIRYLDFTINISPNAGLNGLSSNLIDYLTSLNSQKKSEPRSSGTETKSNSLF